MLFSFSIPPDAYCHESTNINFMEKISFSIKFQGQAVQGEFQSSVSKRRLLLFLQISGSKEPGPLYSMRRDDENHDVIGVFRPLKISLPTFLPTGGPGRRVVADLGAAGDLQVGRVVGRLQVAAGEAHLGIVFDDVKGLKGGRGESSDVSGLNKRSEPRQQLSHQLGGQGLCGNFLSFGIQESE